MFKPERLLGALVSEAIGASLGNSLGRGTRRFLHSRQGSTVGMGLIGLALGAYEHFSQRSNQNQTNPPPPPTQGMVPPPPPALNNASESALPQNEVVGSLSPEESVCLIKAMISAAACDGVIDEEEHQRILSKLESAGLGTEEKSFLDEALAHPLSVNEILALARSLNRFRMVAEDIYVASLLAVRVDAEAEKRYMAELGSGLGLSPVRQAQLQQFLSETSV